LTARIRRLRELLDVGDVLAASRREDVKVRQHLRPVDAHVEHARACRGVERFGKVQTHQIVRPRREASNRVAERGACTGRGRHARRLIHRCRSRIGHLARVDRVGVVNRATARKVLIRHKWAHRRPTGIDADNTRARRGWGNQAIDAYLATAGIRRSEARNVQLAVGDDRVGVLREIVATISAGVLLRIPKLGADVGGGEGADDAGHGAVVGIAAQCGVTPDDGRAVVVPVRRNGQKHAGLTACGRAHAAVLKGRGAWESRAIEFELMQEIVLAPNVDERTQG